MTIRPSDLRLDPADRAALLLGLLGGTPAAVAMSLVCLGHRGLRNPRACPVHQYLASHDIPVDRVDVSDVTLCRADGDWDFLGPPVRVRMPGPVVGFVRDFDEGLHAELDVGAQ